MLLCQLEMSALKNSDAGMTEPAYYTVARYGFDPGLQLKEDVWINWQIGEQTVEIEATVTGRRKEVYVDGQSLVRHMGELEKAKFCALYPEGIEPLLKGASLFVIRIFVEAKDKTALFKVQEAIAQGKKRLPEQKRLSEGRLEG